MNLFFHELKRNRTALIIWSVCIILLMVISMVKYEGISTTGDEINELMDSLPEALKVAMGLNAFNLTQVDGYYGVMFIYFVMLSTIHATMLGASIISKEERDKTTEFLIPKPRKRSQILTAKLSAALVNVVIFNIVTTISSVIGIAVYNKGESITNEILVLMLAMFILQVIYMCFGAFLAAILKNAKTSASIATGVLLVTYFMSMLIDINRDLRFLEFLTPYKYFEAKYLMFGETFKTSSLLLSGAMITIFLVGTYFFYERRDLTL